MNSFVMLTSKLVQHALQGSMFSSDRHLVTDGEEMAREFNTYFSNAFNVEDVDNIPDADIVHARENTLTDIDCSESEIKAKLKKLAQMASY